MELEQALRIVIDHLDEKMTSEPTRELADISNYLEELLTSL